MLMWLTIVLTVATLLTCYLGWRLINPAPLTRKWKLVGWALVAVLLFGQWLIRFLGRGALEGELMNLVQWVGYIFLGLVSILVVLMLARDFPILVKRVMTVLETLFGHRSRRPYFIRPNRERRRFLLNASNAVILTATMPITGYGIFEARRTPSVIHNDLPVPDLPEGLDGFTIAQITDTHIGPTIRGEWLQRVVNEVNALSPDMIVHTGDMVDGTVAALNGAVGSLGELKAPYGTWFCTGNHEYYSGVQPWLRKIRELGMTPLNNEHRLIDTGRGRILLGGVTDIRGGSVYPSHKSSPTQAMADAPEHDVSILLAHQPRSVFEASKAGFNIQLSGHTHGGQYFPYTLAIHLFQPYVRGLHLHENTLLYVSMGTGYWGPPVRLGTEPEITLHTLRRV
ncbi:metallophosphoesterase [Pseudodesulfovibrio cashew]|uniref:Metallophosphoesterase n=1 Tax=Pseudodesulfovibrio cashew TaxID=2678688 RepID=A0A6I6JII6_9BACT|nr:metallophosphoesterase [Pseudodesulfovibrio cashew]QGY40213.1 metallophosphoesterase [Pseudodesulfovibrio cashew]